MSTTDDRIGISDKQEAYHRAAEARSRIFSYEKPALDRVKGVVPIVKGELSRIHVQVVKEGGENNLHYHTGSETTWMVLRGRARFYGVGDMLLGEFGANQGIFIPGGMRYWFEKIGDEDLEILQIVAYDRRDGAKAQRINIDAHKEWMSEGFLQVYEPAKEK